MLPLVHITLEDTDYAIEVEAMGARFCREYQHTAHVHPPYHFILQSEGKCNAIIDEETIYVPKNSFLFFNPMLPHRFAPDPISGVKHESFVFNLRTREGGSLLMPLQQILNINDGSRYDQYVLKQLDQLQAEEFRQLLDRLGQVVNGPESFLFQMRLYSLFFFCLELLFNDHFAQEQRKENAGSNHIIRAKGIVGGEYNNPYLNINLLAKRLKLHPNYLNFLFKKHMGQSASEYLQNYRFKVARHLLENSSMSIGQIAKKCGFEHHSSFSRQFQKLVGISPKDFRTKHD